MRVSGAGDWGWEPGTGDRMATRAKDHDGTEWLILPKEARESPNEMYTLPTMFKTSFNKESVP